MTWTVLPAALLWGTAAQADVPVIVRFHGKVDPARIEEAGGKPGLVSVQLRFVSGLVPASAVSRLRRLPGVAFVQENQRLTLYTTQQNSQVIPWSVERVRAPAAWPTTDGSYTDPAGNRIRVRVAILDSGIDASHPDLAGQTVRGADFTGEGPGDRNGHGTAMAGIVAALNNQIGYVGVAPGAQPVEVKVATAFGSLEESWVADAIRWAADNNCRVISMSFGGSMRTRVLEEAVNYAWNRGAVLVGAAGNSGVNEPEYPSAFPNVICVAGTDENDYRWSGSNYGNWVDISAPARQIPLLWAGGRYETRSGTSASTPHVSAAAALLWAQYPNETNTFIRRQLEAGRRPLPDSSIPGMVDCTPTNRAPSVMITSPAANAEVSGTVVLSAAASDDQAVAGVRFFVDGTQIADDLAAPYEIAWDSRTVADGPHTIRAEARDAQGATGQAQITVTVRNAPDAPPVVWLTAPAADSTVAGTVTVRANATDDRGVAGVRFFADGNLLADDTAAPYEVAWDTRTVSNGPHAIAAEARDTAGQTARAQIQVTVDNNAQDLPPTVTITDPADSATVSGVITIRAQASDDRGIESVEFLVDDRSLGLDTQAPYEIALDSATVSNGPHRLRARARDTVGQTATAEISVTVNNVVPTERTAIFEASNAGHAREWTTLFYPGANPFRAGRDPNNARVYGVVLFETSNLPSGIQILDLQVELTGNWSGLGSRSTAEWRVQLMPASIADGFASLTWQQVAAAVPQGEFSPSIRGPEVGAGVVNRVLLEGDRLLGRRTAVRIFYPDSNPRVEYAWNGAGGSGAPRLIVRYTEAAPAVPSVAITSPVNGATVSGRVTVAASASIPRGTISRVDFAVDGQAIGSASAPPYQVLWDSGSLPDGVHTIRATAVAGDGQTASASIQVTTDNDAPPTVSIQAPPNGATISGTTRILATAADDRGAVRVRFFVDGVPIAEATAAPYEADWDTNRVANGSHTIAAEARDTAGQTAVAEIQVRVENAPADAPPSVTISAPNDGATVSGTVTIRAEASDDRGVVSVRFLVDGALLSEDASSPYEAAWDTSAVAAGSHSIVAEARDTGGQSARTAITVTVRNAAVDQAPVVAIVTPADGASVSGAVTIAATASDDRGVAGVRFLVDGNEIGDDRDAPYEVVWDTDRFANGSHTIAAEARDTSGQTARASVSVTVYNAPSDAPPTVSLDAPADGSTVSGSVGLQASATDDRGVESVEFSVDGAFVGAARQPPYQVNWDSRAAADGQHTIRATARDTAGQTASAEVRVTVNNAPAPVLEALIEAADSGHAFSQDGAFYFPRAEFRSGSDAGGNLLIGMVRFDLAGRVPAGATITRLELELTGSTSTFGIPQGTQWSADVLGEETATGWARLTFAACQSARSLGRFAPVLSRADLGAGRVNRLSLDTSLTAGSGLVVRVNGPAMNLFSFFRWWGAPAPEASNRPRLRVFYRDGRPSVRITQPSDGQALLLGSMVPVAGRVTIVAEASDDVGIARVDFFVGSRKIASVPAPGPYQAVWDTSKLPTGRKILRAVATDVSGQQAAHSIRVLVDREAPRMAVEGPRDNQIVSGTVKVRVFARDNARVDRTEIFVNGELVAENEGESLEVEWDTRGLPKGSYLVRIVATDVVGNRAETASRVRVVGSWEDSPGTGPGGPGVPGCGDRSGSASRAMRDRIRIVGR